MKNSKSLFLELISKISLKESDAEIKAIASLLLESICGLTPAELMAGKPVSPTEEMKLYQAVSRINRSEPLQYILNEAHFFGRKYYVDPSVLIPRPETEELVALVIDRSDRTSTRPVVDVATGSGCIGITLSLELPNAIVWCTDVSEKALSVARRNTDALGGHARMILHDVLNDELPINEVATVVSNPPYIAESEKQAMNTNVVEHEPHLALFVPDANPLIFYEALAMRGMKSLTAGGLLAMEINERFGREVAALMENAGLLGVELVKDLAGKDRFVFARK